MKFNVAIICNVYNYVKYSVVINNFFKNIITDYIFF